MRKLTAVAVVGLLITAPVWAEETAGEKVEEKSNDLKRSVKKGAHQVEEAGCTGTKAECTKKKAMHRGEETKDKAGDKASEVKNKVD